MSEQPNFTPIEAINEYYRLKEIYQSSYYNKYVLPIITKGDKSKKEKRVEYSKLPKHECINCKRNVETIWSSRVDNKENIKYFTAKCGDIQDPCPLDIQINYSLRNPMDKEIGFSLSQIEKIKLRIIKEKNNSLFFKKNVVKIFDSLTEELKLESEHTGFMIETNILKNDNPEKIALLKRNINEFGIGCILPFKAMVSEFNETGNEITLNAAVTFYINEIIPQLKAIQMQKYDVNMVEYDEITNIYKLIQMPTSLESNEFYDKSDDKVVKFNKGIKKVIKKGIRKTRKEGIDGTKQKTRKIKPIQANLVIVGDELEEELEDKGLEDKGLELEDKGLELEDKGLELEDEE